MIALSGVRSFRLSRFVSAPFGKMSLPSLRDRVLRETMPWLDLFTITAGRLSLLAQTSPSPSPTAAPFIDTATVEFLKGQFQSLTTTFNIYVTLLSAVAALFVAFAAWFFKRTLSEAKQEVQQLVREAVKLEIAASIKQRVETLEQILEREEVPGLVSVDYVLQVASGSLPKEYRLLNARFSKIKPRKLDSRQFNGDVVVLDLVNYQPTGNKLEEAELEQVLQAVINKMAPESVLAVYVRGRYSAIEQLSQKIAYYTSTNVPTQLLGNVINCAYVAHALYGEKE